MIVTILEANLEPGRESDLESAYAAAASSGTRPPGLVRSELVRDAHHRAASASDGGVPGR